MAEFTPVRQEWADLRIKEAEARVDAQEAGEKLMALLERTHVDEVDTKLLQKAPDDLLQIVEGFDMEHDLAH